MAGQCSVPQCWVPPAEGWGGPFKAMRLLSYSWERVVLSGNCYFQEWLQGWWNYGHMSIFRPCLVLFKPFRSQWMSPLTGLVEFQARCCRWNPIEAWAWPLSSNSKDVRGFLGVTPCIWMVKQGVLVKSFAQSPSQFQAIQSADPGGLANLLLGPAEFKFYPEPRWGDVPREGWSGNCGLHWFYINAWQFLVGNQVLNHGWCGLGADGNARNKEIVIGHHKNAHFLLKSWVPCCRFRQCAAATSPATQTSHETFQDGWPLHDQSCDHLFRQQNKSRKKRQTKKHNTSILCTYYVHISSNCLSSSYCSYFLPVFLSLSLS